jgi:hypothetical protein
MSSEILSRLHALEAKVQTLPKASRVATAHAVTDSNTPSANGTTCTTSEVEDVHNRLLTAPDMSGIPTPPHDGGTVDGMGEVHLTDHTDANEDTTYFGMTLPPRQFRRSTYRSYQVTRPT